MPRFSANLGFLWTDLPLPDRIAAAAAAGFAAVECHQPFAHSSAEIRDALHAAGVPLVSLNTGLGSDPEVHKGVIARPGREAESRRLLGEAIAYAVDVGCERINVVPGATGREAGTEETFRDNLGYGCELASRHGITLLIEPLSPASTPDAHCSLVEEAVATIEGVGADNLRILFDCFHVQMLQGDAIARLRTHLPLVDHIQIASVPDRAEPDHGELDHAALFDVLDDLGYGGWVGAEYRPRGPVEEGLGWFRAAGGAAR